MCPFISLTLKWMALAMQLAAPVQVQLQEAERNSSLPYLWILHLNWEGSTADFETQYNIRSGLMLLISHKTLKEFYNRNVYCIPLEQSPSLPILHGHPTQHVKTRVVNFNLWAELNIFTTHSRCEKSPYLTEVIRDMFGNSIKGHSIFTNQTLVKALKSTFTYLCNIEGSMLIEYRAKIKRYRFTDRWKGNSQIVEWLSSTKERLLWVSLGLWCTIHHMYQLLLFPEQLNYFHSL